MICRYKPCKEELKWRDRREAYQSDHGGPGPGTRYDVQVIRQVELEQDKQPRVSPQVRVRSERFLWMQPLTSLVLQMSSSVDPQAFPGVAFHGMIPAAEKLKSVGEKLRKLSPHVSLRFINFSLSWSLRQLMRS